jgi:membrane-bound serine protease (ClpP class)
MRKASPVFKALRAGYLASMLLGVLLLVLGSVVGPPEVRASPLTQGGRHVDVATFKLPITPVTAEYYNRLITTAENDGAAALVIQLDTPGGLVDSMLTMVQRTLAADVPVIV